MHGGHVRRTAAGSRSEPAEEGSPLVSRRLPSGSTDASPRIHASSSSASTRRPPSTTSAAVAPCSSSSRAAAGASSAAGEWHTSAPATAVAGTTAPPKRQRGAYAPLRLLPIATVTSVSPSDGPLVGESAAGRSCAV